jgi:hypothetical protein
MLGQIFEETNNEKFFTLPKALKKVTRIGLLETMVKILQVH